ncbi:MAG TPA: cytochrome c peroxidase [Pirellulales bacterium]|jgi:cytochrome c peroxidase|nr:cytochrome c peroxidase [Pirellulales bacterium]
MSKLKPDSHARAGLALVAAGAIALCAGDLAEVGFSQEDKDASLLEDARKVLQPLPKDAATDEHPVAPDRVSLGRMLFFDPRISIDGTGSCVHCHQPALYGTDALPTSRGIGNKLAPRNAPTVLNSALQFTIHWDGVFENVEEKARRALIGPGFGNPDHAAAMARVRAIAGYPELFRKAFPDQADPVTENNWGKAIGAYERTLITPSRFDEFLNGKIEALSAIERSGLRMFIKQGCSECHGGAGVGGQAFEKFGVVDDYWPQTHSQEIDKGRFNVTKDSADLYLFKVPMLRNVAMTPPYFHDGSVETLAEAVRVMAKVQLDTELSEQETSAIVSFLGSLTSALPEDFANAPLLPPAAFDPLPSGSANKDTSPRKAEK